MKRTDVLAGLSLAAAIVFVGPSLAADFACPDVKDLANPPAVAQLDARLPKGFALEQSDPLVAAITLLREHGLSTGNTIIT